MSPGRVVVAGAGGFIGGHLVERLMRRGHRVRGVDVKMPQHPAEADEFLVLDLREPANCREAVTFDGRPADAVYQLAADMGGMGYIHSAESDIMRNNALLNIHMADAAASAGVPRYFFSSSACVYRDQRVGEAGLSEEDAYPALPDNEYGWEKLYAERLAMTFGRRSGMEVRIARFQNCYGPYGTWDGGREKAPAALCRKVAMAADGDAIEVWGDGTARRPFIYVDDLCRAVLALMESDIRSPTNIGTAEEVSVLDLFDILREVSGKSLCVEHVDGPVGVEARYHSIERILSTGWRPRVDLREGLARTYRWIERQVAEKTAAPPTP